jgi:hypothetical protein
MAEFERYTVGTVWQPELVLSLFLRSILLVVGAIAVVALAYAVERRRRGGGVLVVASLLLVALASPWAPSVMEFAFRGRFHLTNAVVLGAAAAAAWPRRSGDDEGAVWITLAAALQTWRSPLFGGIGVYSAFYLPAGIVVLCWLFGKALARLGDVRDRVAWSRAATSTFAVWCVLAFLVSARVFRGEVTERVETARGTLYVPRAIAPAFTGLLDVVRSSTAPGEPVLLLPEDNVVNFLAARRSVHRYYQLIPGILDVDGERDVIASAEREGVRLVSISNRATGEYGATFFGIDYDREIQAWVQSHFRLAHRLGTPVRPAGHDASLMFPAEGYGVDVYFRNG